MWPGVHRFVVAGHSVSVDPYRGARFWLFRARLEGNRSSNSLAENCPYLLNPVAPNAVMFLLENARKNKSLVCLVILNPSLR